MPAIRTNDCGRSPFAPENSACTVNWLANGLANFVYARYEMITMAITPIAPAWNRVSRSRFLRLGLRLNCFQGRWEAAGRTADCG
jgi:hypothetical protein